MVGTIGTTREKTIEVNRKNLLKIKNFSFLSKNQYSPNKNNRLRLDFKI